MRTLKTRLAGVAALAVTAGTLTMAAPAHAVDGPTSTDDICFVQRTDAKTSTTSSCNVLYNDSSPRGAKLTLTSIEVHTSEMGIGPEPMRIARGPAGDLPLTWDADGTITVNNPAQWPSGFMNDLSQWPSGTLPPTYRAVEVRYTATDGYDTFSGTALIGENGPIGGVTNEAFRLESDQVKRFLNGIDNVFYPLANDIVPAGSRIVAASTDDNDVLVALAADGQSIEVSLSADKPSGFSIAYVVEAPNGARAAFGYVGAEEGFLRNPDVDWGPDAPEASPDDYSPHGFSQTPVGEGVLDNDKWDPTLSATVTRAEIRSAQIQSHRSMEVVDLAVTDATIDWSPDGAMGVSIKSPKSSSNYRVTVAYEITDSLGRRSESTATFGWSTPEADVVLAPLVANDDELHVRYIRYPDDIDPVRYPNLVDNPWAMGLASDDISVIWNDTYGSDARAYDSIEIVEPPKHEWLVVANGKTLERGTPPAGYSGTSEPFTDSFTYQLCRGSECSATAQVQLSVRFDESVTAVPQKHVVAPKFWAGSADELAFSPEQYFRSRTPNLGSEPGFDFENFDFSELELQGPVGGSGWSLKADEKGSWILKRVSADAPAGTFSFVWSDYSGQQRAVLVVKVGVESPEAPTAKDDVRWVGLGRVIDDVQIDVNDIGTPGFFDPVEWMPAADGRKLLDRGGFAWLDEAELGDLRSGDRYSSRYVARTTTGTDVIRYRVCTAYPVMDEACAFATMRVHVSPLSGAKNDSVTTNPDESVKALVLSNDIYTDTDTQRASVQILKDTVPAGVEVKVNDDREVIMTAPARYAGETVEFDYRLTDFTRATTAKVRIQVGEPAVIIPEPTPPATPKPEPTPPVRPEPKPPVTPKPVKGPKAKADRGHTMVDLPTTVSVLKNDRFAGKAQVELTGVPKGAKAVVTKTGKVKVTAGQRWAGKTVRFGYTLTDETGKRSKTTVQVQVDPIPIIVTGADRSTPEASTDVESVQQQDSATRVAFVGTGGVLIAVGIVVGALWLRRSRM